MAQTRLKSGNLHMVGGDNGTDGNVLKSKGDGTMEWGTIIINPTFSSFDYPGDDTALDPAGGQSLVINGGGFNAGVTVTIDGTTPSSITRNSDSQLTVTTPAKSAGSQAVVISNTDGGRASTNVSYKGIPAFTNGAGSLGSVKEGESINVSAAATEPDGGAITYAITSGALPSGVSLNASTGAITGTAPSVSADTTSNFTVTATDDENQSTARAYSITVTPILPSDSFSAVTYTGNGSTQSITGVGFQPDFVWIKGRTSADNNFIFDSTRGDSVTMNTNLQAPQYADTGITSFDTGGFTLGSGAGENRNGDDYVAWCLKANGGTTTTGTGTGGVSSVTHQLNSDAGFCITKFTVPSASGGPTTTHGLDSTPDFIIMKRITAVEQSWWVWHNSFTSGNDYLQLQTTGAKGSSVNVWNGTAPDATKVTLGAWNLQGDDYIMYAFKNVDGFSKFGSYTGNGSTDGPIVETGFEPAFLLIKPTNITGHWRILDNKRNQTNPRNSTLKPDESEAETTHANEQVDFLSNGFQLKTAHNGRNGNGDNYIYIAFAADPDTTAPTLADSFGAVTYTGDGNSSRVVTGLDFKPDLIWNKQYNGTTNHVLTDSVTGLNKYLTPSNSNAAASSTYYSSFNSNGWTMGNNHLNANSNESFINWAWKAGGGVPTYNTTGSINSTVSANANAGFSISNFTGTGSAGTVAHGLSSTPEFVIIKNVSNVGSWLTWHKDYGGGDKYIYLDSSNAVATQSQFFNSTAPTSSVFSVGNHGDINGSGHHVAAYCFHSVSGYSKIGSYTGTGSSGNAQSIGFQPDFVMIKSKANYNWNIYDSKRPSGSITGRYMLIANANDSQYTTSVVHIDLTSTGFSFPNGYDGSNKSSQEYIYMAFKIN